MTKEERDFMRSQRGGKSPGSRPPNPEQMDLLSAQREWGREGMRKRWGEHGPTKCVRAFTATVDRFRAHVTSERDRAAAATEALDNWLDEKGAAIAAPVSKVGVLYEPIPEPPPLPKGVTPVTINAVLTYHWYGEIEAGRKTVEYRQINEYWTSRLWANGLNRRVRAIRFSRGYTDERMTWEVVKITRDEAEGVYEIHLGKRIS